MNNLFNGFNRAWSIKRPYMTLDDGPHYRPATNYEYGMMPPRYPMPAIRYDVAYQVDDGDYWCAIYDTHKLENDAQDCCTILYNVRDDPLRHTYIYVPR